LKSGLILFALPGAEQNPDNHQEIFGGQTDCTGVWQSGELYLEELA